ncbi:MAG: glycosyltransferase [Planctomycetaceae bacterium]
MIPAVAHWIWLNETLPPWAASNIDSFRSLHPKWTVRVWHELPGQFPFDLRVLFQQLPWYSSRSDIFRYWLLAKYGGVYLDTDIVALRNFDFLLEHEFFLAPCQPTGHIQPHLACGLMGSIPGSRSALRILEACRKRAELPEPPRRITYGPDLLTRLFAEDREGLTVLPMHYFYAIPDRETTHEFWHADSFRRAEIMKRFESTFTDNEPPYAVHLWGVDGSSQRKVKDPDIDLPTQVSITGDTPR